MCRSPGDSWVPANHEPIITWDAPAASASATSRGWRTPPSAQTCLPCSRAASTHSTTALNCGRPTPVIIRVVHIAPGPTPTLMMSAPASTRSCTPSAATTLPATIGTLGSTRADGGQRLEHPLLVAVRGVDDEAVDAHRQQPLGLAGDVAVDADRGGDPQPTEVVQRGRVDRRPQRTGAGQDADQLPVVVDRRREPVAGRGEHVERLARLHRVLEGDHVGRHHVADLGEAVDAGQSASVMTPTGRPSSSTTAARWARLGSSARASLTVSCGPRVIGVSKTGCRRFTQDDDVLDDVERDVLRDHADATAAGDRLGHPAAGDGGHVGDDDRDRRTRAVARSGWARSTS